MTGRENEAVTQSRTEAQMGKKLQKRALNCFPGKGHTLCPKPLRGFFRAVVLTLWSGDQLHQHHLGTCQGQRRTSPEPCEPRKQQWLGDMPPSPPPLLCFGDSLPQRTPPPTPYDLDKTHSQVPPCLPRTKPDRSSTLPLAELWINQIKVLVNQSLVKLLSFFQVLELWLVQNSSGTAFPDTVLVSG